jgi:hypothetical protein
MLWNRLTTQDTHDQESNAPSAPLAKCTRFGCARDWKDKQQWLAGEAPSATARFYSNGRNSYSCLVSCARRPSKMQAALLPCSVHFVRCFVAFVNAFALVSTGCKTFVQTFETVWYYLFVSEKLRQLTKFLVWINLHQGYPKVNPTSILVKCWTWLNTANCRKRVIFGIYFSTYCDNYYSSFCSRVTRVVQIHFFRFWTRRVSDEVFHDYFCDISQNWMLN